MDLIYLDPPFNSNASYNVLFKGPTGRDSAAQIEAFDDTWHWGEAAEAAYRDVLHSGSDAGEMLRAMRAFLGDNDMMAYLAMMAVRMLELHRVLKPTGSLYLHCDPTASHYLKILLDAVFGARNFRNEVIWKRTTAHSDTKGRFSHETDTILFFVKCEGAVWNSQFQPHAESYIKSHYRHEDKRGRHRHDNIIRSQSMGPRPNLSYEYSGFTPPYGWRVKREKLEELDADNRLYWSRSGTPYLKRYLDEQPGEVVGNIWQDIPPLNSQAQERLGYPTQKPVALLERILAASSNPGDVVLDPFCGCGTSVHAAQKMDRRWIGIDVTHLAIGLIEKRLRDAFPGIAFDTHGTPQDLSGARDLAHRGRVDPRYYHEFEKWALSLVDAKPTKRSGDGGIDGNLYFGKPERRAIVEVKSGKVGTPQVARLRGALERHGADIGVFLSLEEPNKGMRAEAAAAGHVEIDGFAPVPRLQLVTVEQAMALRDRAIRLPLARDDAPKARREEDATRQGRLDL
ncbi:MAG: DNA methyltransferase [Rhodobacteraceae bacterium]|nr:DNA methyltransferase [Paracoccaceae bacterium]